MKASKYNILFDYKGKKLAFNGLSASFAEVEDDFIRLIENLPKSSDEKGLSSKDIKLLEDMKRGYFVLDDDDDEFNMLKLNSYRGKFGSKGFSLTIAPTLQCNLACPYCYEQRQTGVMNQEIRNAIIERVKKEAENKNNISITWYGGEPLLAKDVIAEMSAEMIKICQSAGVKYYSSIITNGYLIDSSIINMLQESKVYSAQITVDGPPAIHDARRKLYNGEGTFATIIENIKRIREAGINVHIRVNVDKTNIDKLEELLKILADNNLQKCSIGLGHVKDYTNVCSSVVHTCLNNKEYAEATLNYQKVLLKYGFKAENYPYYPGVKANYCCADALNAYVVGPDGMLYKCWNDIGNAKRSVGNIKESQQKYNKLYLDYLMWSPFDYEKCRECSYLPLCMGDARTMD